MYIYNAARVYFSPRSSITLYSKMLKITLVLVLGSAVYSRPQIDFKPKEQQGKNTYQFCVFFSIIINIKYNTGE